MQDGRQLKLLFLCTGNSCRSQMAEGRARSRGSDAIEACSAGVDPHGLNPLAVKVMAEAGVDISQHHSKHIDELKHVPFDNVITVCDNAHETCPVFPESVRQIHRNFADPPRLTQHAATKDEALSHYRRVRDDIRAFVESLLAELETE